MRRIQRAVDKEDLINRLTREEPGIFKEIWKLMIFAAFLGYSLKRREKLKKIESGKSIDENIFSNNCPAWPGILYILALAETGKTDVLSGGDKTVEDRLILFEEYANGGLAEIKERLEVQAYSLDSFVGLIMELTTNLANSNISLSGIKI